MKNSWERWRNDSYKFFTHMYSNTYIYTCIVYIYIHVHKKLQVKFAYLSYVLRQLHFLVTSKRTIWEWYYLTKWSHTRVNPQWSSLFCTNNAMMRTTVRLNHNFKENPVRGRHCDGVRDSFLVFVVVKDVPLAICCGPNFLQYLTS